ncbi:MAG: flagellar biosynthesis protein FlhB [Alphaproteobacteria bacterium]|nr:flagellar biosynthesis protein FlhB [Alphaproteobacteria bacterium]
MSEQTDDLQKTEEPTPKKLEEGRKKGQVAVSREINTWVTLLVGTLVVGLMAPRLMTDIRVSLLPFVETPHLQSLDTAAAGGQVLFSAFSDAIGALMLPLLFFFLIAAAGPILQNGLVYSPKVLEIKSEKISPVKGVKRVFSVKQFMEFVKGLFKISIVGAVGLIVVLPTLSALDIVPTFSLPDFLSTLHGLVMKMLIAVVAVLFVIAFIDVIFQRQQHHKEMRMTKQEVKEEFKQSEGDPVVKQRLRQIRQDRARNRMMQAVPEADVVVTNPTHYAIALKYKPADMAAPILVAKGADLVAQRIRELAAEHDITIVENPPLARALYASVELDAEVPAEHYQAVAEVISYVWGLKGRSMPVETPRAG